MDRSDKPECYFGCICYDTKWHDEYGICCHLLQQKLLDIVKGALDRGFTHFICGMNRGAELLFAGIVLNLRKVNDNIRLTIILPDRDYTKDWTEEDRRRHKRILAACNHAVFISTRDGDYTEADHLCKKRILELSERSVMFRGHLPLDKPEQRKLERSIFTDTTPEAYIRYEMKEFS